MPLRCKWFGHKWDYSIPRQRSCKRCPTVQDCIKVVIPEEKYEVSQGVILHVVGINRLMWVNRVRHP